ncbi:MAG: type 4a pilus biogenesis protein PilO [Elusimicrobia bacterium]|nr:type 4a pilus biogenesis protein PilO [Elusimicrobiota bacterium]
MDKIKLTKEQITQIAAGVFFGGLFIFAYLNYFWLPLSKTITENISKVASLESEINKAKMLKAKYKDLEAKLESLKSQKEAAQKKLPHDRKLPDLLRTIINLSKVYKVNIQSISSPASGKEAYFIKASYQISVLCDYHALGRFMTALGLEERIMTTENLTISATPGSDTSISASFTLVVFQYNG